MSQNQLLQESVFLVGTALAFAFGICYSGCLIATDCVARGDCVRVNLESSQYLPQCNFKSVPGMVGILNYIDDTESNNSASLELALQAYCPPGERLQSYSGAESCTPQYSYPNSVQTEIFGDPTSTLHSKRMCGAWIDAASAPSPTSASYWSFSGIDLEADAVRDAALAEAKFGLTRTNLGKVSEQCQQTSLAGMSAILASAKTAYHHLLDESSVGFISDSDSALRALGVLAGHHCDSAVNVGWTYSTSTDFINPFSATMYRGSRFSDTSIGEALQLVQEPDNVIQSAVNANARVNAAADTWTGYPLLSTMERVYEGASGRLDHANVSLSYEQNRELSGFQIVADQNPHVAADYLRGVAATCSFVLSSQLSSGGYTTLPSWSASQRELNERRESKSQITALGRLKRSIGLDTEPMQEMDLETMKNATSATFSQLVPSSFSSAEEQCSNLVSAVFPDTIDAERFRVIYRDDYDNGALYTKLEILTRRIQGGVAAVLREDERIRKVLQDPDLVAADVEKVRVRIPGAPRGTWAGADRSLPFALISSEDSIFKMVLKQSRALFLDRHKMVFESTDLCEAPSVMDSLTANAYIYPGAHCSYYLLGLSIRPFLGPQLDEESILSRFGYIIAHEMAHSTMNTPFVTSELEKLLHRYDPSTFTEAIADIVGGMGLLRSNSDWAYKLDAQKLCDHVAQTWCARVGSMYYSGLGGVHPKANLRADFFCDTLLVDLSFDDARL